MTSLSGVKHFVGRAAPIAQVDTLTLGGTWVADETITITIGTVEYTYTVVTGSEDTESIIQGIVDAHNALRIAYGQIYEVATSYADPVLTFKSNTLGYPYDISVSSSTASGTAVLANVTTATGPADLNNADNYEEGALPTGSDTIIFQNSDQDVFLNLDQLDTHNILVRGTFTGKIGLPATNVWNAALPYAEYRSRFLDRYETSDIIGEGNGTAPNFVALDYEDTNSTLYARLYRNSAINLEIQSATSATITVVDGNAKMSGVGQCTLIFETEGWVDIFQSDTLVITNRGATVSLTDCVGCNLTQTKGTTTITGTSTITTGPIVSGGTFRHEGTGTLGGNIELSGSAKMEVCNTFTISNAIKLYNDAGYHDPNSYIAAPVLQFEKGAKLSNSDLGESFQITRANY